MHPLIGQGNRLFAGVGTDSVVHGIRAEAGYVNVAVRTDRRVDHALMINLMIKLPPRS